MNNKTLTRADLGTAVYDACDLPFATAGTVVDAVIDEMVETIVSEGSLKMSGFGTFRTQRKKERIGRNPKNGVAAVITSRTVLVFSPSNLVKKAVNEALSDPQMAQRGGSIK